MEKVTSKLGLKISLSSKDINEDEILNLGGKILTKDNNSYVFIYSKDINSLIQSLSKYTVDELLIEKENLEDTFLNYYEDKGDEI